MGRPDQLYVNIILQNCNAERERRNFYSKNGNNVVAVTIIPQIALSTPAFVLTYEIKNQRSGVARYGFPGGKLDGAEDAISAASRELEEEIGAAVRIRREHFLFRLLVDSDPVHSEKSTQSAINFYHVILSPDMPLRPGVEQIKIVKAKAGEISKLASEEMMFANSAAGWEKFKRLKSL